MSEESEVQSKIDALEALVFELQANQNTQDDLSTYNGGHVAENLADETENHSWKVTLSVVSGTKKYTVDDGGGNAGTVFMVDGTAVDVPAVALTTYSSDVSLYLKVVLTSSSAATATIEVGTRPTTDMTADNPIFVFDLAQITNGDDTVRQYLTQDVSFQGLSLMDGDQYQVWQKKSTGWGFDDVRMTA